MVLVWSAMSHSEIGGSIKGDVNKKLLPRPVTEKFFVSISSPLSVGMPLDRSRGFSLACSPIPAVSSFGGDNANRFLKLGKRFHSVSTMVLSEARGLSLFLVLRGGIAWEQ
jgi:hypothetical protein